MWLELMVVILEIITSFLHFTLTKWKLLFDFAHKNPKDEGFNSSNQLLSAFYGLSIDQYTIIILIFRLRNSKRSLILRFPLPQGKARHLWPNNSAGLILLQVYRWDCTWVRRACISNDARILILSSSPLLVPLPGSSFSHLALAIPNCSRLSSLYLEANRSGLPPCLQSWVLEASNRRWWACLGSREIDGGCLCIWLNQRYAALWICQCVYAVLWRACSPVLFPWPKASNQSIQRSIQRDWQATARASLDTAECQAALSCGGEAQKAWESSPSWS